MANDPSSKVAPSTFRFSVQFDQDISATFQEAELVHTALQSIESSFYPIKMPGLGKVGNVILRQGIFVNSAKFTDWYNSIKLNRINASEISIRPMSDEEPLKMFWTLTNARPTNVGDMETLADGGAAVESVELACHRLIVTVP